MKRTLKRELNKGLKLLKRKQSDTGKIYIECEKSMGIMGWK